MSNREIAVRRGISLVANRQALRRWFREPRGRPLGILAQVKP